MVQDNLVNIAAVKKQKTNKIISITLVVIATLSVIIFSYLKENPILPDIEIPKSDNISYNLSKIDSITPKDIIANIDNNLGKPILLHFYTTWCSICRKQMPIINEVARKFQNTDLQVMVISVEKGASPSKISRYMYKYGHVYFRSNYLLYSYGLKELLEKKSIRHRGKVPLTVVIDRNGKIIAKYNGIKSQRYLNNKIMSAL